jgi:hypothetical protein
MFWPDLLKTTSVESDAAWAAGVRQATHKKINVVQTIRFISHLRMRK